MRKRLPQPCNARRTMGFHSFDIFQYLSKRTVPFAAQRIWLLLSDRPGLPWSVQNSIQENCEYVIAVDHNVDFGRPLKSEDFSAVVIADNHLWSIHSAVIVWCKSPLNGVSTETTMMEKCGLL